MKRNFGLDIIRAISIWLVLLQHAGINIPGLHSLKIGGIGVEFFFVLSGFLIGGILFREIDKGNDAIKTLKSFWIRRWYRILPLYYAVLLFKFIFIDHSIGYNILYYVFFLQNNFYGIGFLDVSWSLVIEEWFYIVSPIFLFYATKWLKTERKIFFSIVGFILGVIVLRTIYVMHGNVPYSGVNSNFPFRFDTLFLGVLLAFFKYRKWKVFDFLASRAMFLFGISSFGSYIYYFWSLAHPVNHIDILYFPRTIGFFILPLTISLMIPFVSRIELKSDNNHFASGLKFTITWTSILTYAIYLIHPFVYNKLLYTNLIEISGIRILLSITITYIVAALVYHLFEKPILVYRDKITNYEK